LDRVESIRRVGSCMSNNPLKDDAQRMARWIVKKKSYDSYITKEHQQQVFDIQQWDAKRWTPTRRARGTNVNGRLNEEASGTSAGLLENLSRTPVAKGQVKVVARREANIISKNTRP